MKLYFANKIKQNLYFERLIIYFMRCFPFCNIINIVLIWSFILLTGVRCYYAYVSIIRYESIRERERERVVDKSHYLWNPIAVNISIHEMVMHRYRATYDFSSLSPIPAFQRHSNFQQTIRQLAFLMNGMASSWNGSFNPTRVVKAEKEESFFWYKLDSSFSMLNSFDFSRKVQICLKTENQKKMFKLLC